MKYKEKSREELRKAAVRRVDPGCGDFPTTTRVMFSGVASPKNTSSNLFLYRKEISKVLFLV
jgi:hypothetical protein